MVGCSGCGCRCRGILFGVGVVFVLGCVCMYVGGVGCFVLGLY